MSFILLVEQVAPETPSTGQVILYPKSDGLMYTKDDGGSERELQAGAPTGSVIAFAGSSAPTDWLLCYGQAVSRTTYAALFAVTSTTYGVGDGSTTFNLPDLRGRTPFGKDDMGGVAASRVTNGESGITGTTLGSAGGDERLSQHLHAVGTLAISGDGGHQHSYLAGNAIGSGRDIIDAGGDTGVQSFPESGANGTHSHTISGSTANTGGNTTSQNMPPAIILNYIIKI